MPRTLRRLVEDSERHLRQGEHLLWEEDEETRQTERALHREAHDATRRVEETGNLRTDAGLWELCERLVHALKRQEQSGRRFNLAAEAYNAALREPPVQLLAPMLGFLRVPRP